MLAPNPELLALNVDGPGAWQPSQTVKTPGTRLTWSCLASWVETLKTLQRRRVSAARYRQESAHIRALPLPMIARETNPEVLCAFLEVMASNAGNWPRKGKRDGHPATEMIMVANNRLAHLGALPYRKKHWRQKAHRTPFRTAPGSRNPARKQGAEVAAPHLSLF